MYVNNDIDYLSYLRERDVIIFGAGENGKVGFRKLNKANIRIVAFCDNDEQKQNQVQCGVQVISFARLMEINHDTLMIVICSNYEREIKQQLLHHNIYNFISITQIDFGGREDYYDEHYFAWQCSMGKFGGKIKAGFFKPHIREHMTVVEFGSGGGFLLNNLHAKKKIGIEINDTARAMAKEIGIDSVKNIKDIPDNYADIVISTSATSD